MSFFSEYFQDTLFFLVKKPAKIKQFFKKKIKQVRKGFRPICARWEFYVIFWDFWDFLRFLGSNKLSGVVNWHDFKAWGTFVLWVWLCGSKSWQIRTFWLKVQGQVKLSLEARGLRSIALKKPDLLETLVKFLKRVKVKKIILVQSVMMI